MPGAGVNFEVVLQDQEVQHLLRVAISRAKRLHVPFKRISVYMYGRIAKVFRQEGYPTKWKPLSPVTIARRRKGRGRNAKAVQAALNISGQHGIAMGAKILQDTGRLRASVTGARARGSILRITDKLMELGTRVKYALDHQVGRASRAGVVVSIRSHKRRGYYRYHGGVAVYIRPTTVRAHKRTTTIPAVPARPFLFWLPEDVRVVIDLLRKTVFGY